jgi:hypothetical protein
MAIIQKVSTPPAKPKALLEVSGIAYALRDHGPSPSGERSGKRKRQDEMGNTASA